MSEPVLAVSGLRAYYRTSAFGVEREVRAVDDISLSIAANEIYGLAGESSSGKTTLIKTIANAIQPPLEVLAGSVVFNFRDRSVDIHDVDRKELAAIRWKHLSYIMQGSMNVLNPVRRVRHSFVDFAFRHIGKPMPAFLEIVRDHLQRLHLAPEVLEAFPHQLSGGMRQRVTIALATVCRPEFIIADEPTTALDVVVQKGVLAMIHEIQRELGSSILFVTHDMSVHANLADRLGIMYAGRLVEEGRTADVFRAPRHPYTAHLIASLPRLGDIGAQEGTGGRAAQPCRPAAGLPLPSALPARHRDLPARDAADGLAGGRPSRRLFPSRRSRRHEPAAARSLRRGADLCDRRLLATPGHRRRRRQPAPRRGTARDLHHRGRVGQRQDHAGPHDPGHGGAQRRHDPLPGHRPRRRSAASARRLAFMKQVQPIFQNPFEAFNPMKRVDRYLFVTARRMAGLAGDAGIAEATDGALKSVGLSLAEIRGRFPHELSGGQLQRVAIARALISKPALLVADEPVSMIDASLRASIVNLLRDLRDRLGVAIIYITHDLATAYYISDRILIMRQGSVVESGDARSVLDNPQHPYSQLLKRSVLSPDVPAEAGARLRADPEIPSGVIPHA